MSHNFCHSLIDLIGTCNRLPTSTEATFDFRTLHGHPKKLNLLYCIPICYGTVVLHQDLPSVVAIGKYCLPAASVDTGFSCCGFWRLRVGAIEVVEEVWRRAFRVVPMAGGRLSTGGRGVTISNDGHRNRGRRWILWEGCSGWRRHS